MELEIKVHGKSSDFAIGMVLDNVLNDFIRLQLFGRNKKIGLDHSSALLILKLE